jgi:Transposase and inactivated derivatives
LKYEIEDIYVPEDREGKFRTGIFNLYARSIGIDELIISLYSMGISTRKMSEILESIFQNRYSRSSIPRITEITIEEVKRFQNRPLDRRYIAIFLDALFFYLRGDTVDKEPIIFAMGIKESGEYEIIFYISSKESHLSYSEVINDLYNRGVREPLLFIADGIPKLDEEIRKVFPRADFQLCTVHASRNFESEIREYDVDIIDSQLKQIFLSEDREEAIKRFNEFKSIWENKYPKQVYNLERKLNYLFTYFQYPEPIRRSIHSNIIEIMNKEIRRRIKTIDSLPTEESAMKIIYLRVAELNEKWSHREINGYFKCKDELMEMFSKRYP